ncbi:unnamed protein product, partial [marine sediment metagenome]
FESGNSKKNTVDVTIQTDGVLIARAFAYETISNSGILIPSGSRITFEYNLNGNVSTGRCKI